MFSPRFTALAALPFATLILGVALTATSANLQDGSETTSLDGVDSVAIDGVGQAFVTIGSPAEVTISAPQEILDQITVAVADDAVEIAPVADAISDQSGAQDIRYDITVERLEDLRINGAVRLESGDIAADSGIQGDDLDIALEGASTAILFGVLVTEIDVDVRGASYLMLTGESEQLDVDARESSTFDGYSLAAESADVDARDAAQLTVNATESLEAEARAAATVVYVGNPAQTEFTMFEAGIIRPYDGLPPTGGGAVVGTPEATPIARRKV